MLKVVKLDENSIKSSNNLRPDLSESQKVKSLKRNSFLNVSKSPQMN